MGVVASLDVERDDVVAKKMPEFVVLDVVARTVKTHKMLKMLDHKKEMNWLELKGKCA